MRYTDPSGHVTCEGDNWDDGPHCLKNPDSDLSRAVANTKYQKDCWEGRRQDACPGGAEGLITFGVTSIVTIGFAEFYLLGGVTSLSPAAIAKLRAALINAGLNAGAECLFTAGGGGSCSVQQAVKTGAFSVIMGDVLGKIATKYGSFKSLPYQSLAQFIGNSMYRSWNGDATTFGDFYADIITPLNSYPFNSLSATTASHLGEGTSTLLHGAIANSPDFNSIVLFPSP